MYIFKERKKHLIFSLIFIFYAMVAFYKESKDFLDWLFMIISIIGAIGEGILTIAPPNFFFDETYDEENA